jgi:hypothetical protein
LQHPSSKNNPVKSRVTEGVAKMCGKQEDRMIIFPEYVSFNAYF